MMKRAIVLLVLALSAVACSERSPQERRSALHLPPVGFKGDVAQGRALYGQYCVACHGPGGSGTHQGPPLVHPRYRPAQHADLAFRLAVKNGVKAHHWHFGDMAPLPEVTPEMTQHIIVYIRRLQRAANID